MMGGSPMLDVDLMITNSSVLQPLSTTEAGDLEHFFADWQPLTAEKCKEVHEDLLRRLHGSTREMRPWEELCFLHSLMTSSDVMMGGDLDVFAVS